MKQNNFLILLFVFSIVKAQDEEISRQNKLFLFKVNTTQCSMYSNKCFLNVLAKDLDLNSTKSENDKLFTVISVTKCEKDSPNNTQLCPDFDYFNLTSNYLLLIFIMKSLTVSLHAVFKDVENR